MPSIIPSPGTPGTAPNSGRIHMTAHAVINQGEVVYTASDDTLYFQTTGTWYGITNAGSLWNIGAGDVWLARGSSVGYINNSGLMVAHSTGETARTIYVGSSWEGGLTNTGQIYAIAPEWIAAAVWDYHDALIFNSGLIAAQGHFARTIQRMNGGVIENTATGQILAEGDEATAIYHNGGHFIGLEHNFIDIDNAGVIRAESTSAVASIAIRTWSYDYTTIRNSGSIIADVAFYAENYGHEGVFNLAGGLIVGDFYLGEESDLVDNDGLIQGDVRLENGDDTFDNTQGQLEGGAFLGWGHDIFRGGESSDLVQGDRGNDSIGGGGGADLLIGGRGDDWIAGGEGNDRLYGEHGDDVITALGGDFINAGTGADTIILRDLTFADIDGGSGADTIVLPDTAIILDLSAAIATGRIHGVEQITLPGAQGLVVRANDVAAISGGNQLVVSGGAGGAIYLIGAWTASGDAVVNNVTYESYGLDGATVLVSPATTVNVQGTPPAGTVGLDAVAGGDQAPLPGAYPGIDVSPDITYVSGGYFAPPTLIEAEEHYVITGAAGLLAEYSVTSYGTITGNATSQESEGVTVHTHNGDFTNYGIVETTVSGLWAEELASNISHYQTYGADQGLGTPGGAMGVLTGNGLNYGTISATSQMGSATGLYISQFNATNFGTINAVSHQFIAFGISYMNTGTVINEGDITATGAYGAFGITADTHAFTLLNSGTITAIADPGREEVAVALYYSSGIHNIVNTGVITGEVAIRTKQMVNGGALHLDNSGTINGMIRLNVQPSGTFGRDDWVLNSGTINGEVRMGGALDLHQNVGNGQSGAVYGEYASDVLLGGVHADILDGGDADDLLQGGAGADQLTGGAGRDVFRYLTISDSTAAAFDTITDFVSGTDRIDLTSLSPINVDISFVAGISTLTANTVSGALVVRIAGTVAQSDLILSEVATLTGTAGDDLLVATAGGSTLVGLAGVNFLVGGNGNDVLDGRGGRDIMLGGLGNDFYYVNSRDDALVEGFNEGIDTIQTSVGQLPSGFELPDNFENLILSGSSDYAIGNSLDNVLTANNSRASRLAGHSGDDTLVGGALADVMNGGDGFDTLSYVASNAGVTINLASSTASGGYAQGDTFSFVENATGSAHADVITGSTAGNTLRGEGGADILNGGGGADLLQGGDGDDTLAGGAGADTLGGGAGFDTADYSTSAASVTVNLITGAGHGGDAEDDFLASIERVVGSAHSDVLIGRDGVADTLDGGGGDDVLRGGTGGDTMHGGDGVDTLDYSNSFNGVDVRLFQTSAAGGSSNGDTYSGIENIRGSNSFTDTLVGNDGVNYIWGGGGNETINGRDGNDHLFGEDGNDTVLGGVGEDVLYGSLGNDTVGGGVDDDTVDYSASNAGVTVNLATGVGSGGHAQGDTLVSVENVIGSAFDDIIIGKANFWDNVFDGRGGNDTLTGGNGNDTFVFRLNDGSDTVTDFGSGTFNEDVIQLTDWGVAFDTFAEVIAVASQSGADVVFDFGNGQSLKLNNVTLGNLNAGDFLFA